MSTHITCSKDPVFEHIARLWLTQSYDDVSIWGPTRSLGMFTFSCFVDSIRTQSQHCVKLVIDFARVPHTNSYTLGISQASRTPLLTFKTYYQVIQSLMLDVRICVKAASAFWTYAFVHPVGLQEDVSHPHLTKLWHHHLHAEAGSFDANSGQRQYQIQHHLITQSILTQRTTSLSFLMCKQPAQGQERWHTNDWGIFLYC